MEASGYKCPNCDAELIFDPSSQNINCQYCRSSFTVAHIKELYGDLEVSPPTTSELEDPEFNTNLYHCNTCGAEIMTSGETTATFCYYCHNPVIIAGRLTGDYKPSKIIGFRITREQAVESFKKWCKSKKYIPKDFKSAQQLEKMTGLYVPFWVTNCDINADYHAVGKNIRSWTSGNYRYTETKEYSIDRSAKIIAKGIPADGASKIEDALMESIEPYNYNDLKDFNMSYFSGFFADKYDVDKAAVFPCIQARACDAGKTVIRESIGHYSTIHVQHESYNVMRTEWNYIMLPVWFMTYNYNGKMYEFALNGQTGKIAGTPPLDKGKLLRNTLLYALLIIIAIFIGGQFVI